MISINFEIGTLFKTSIFLVLILECVSAHRNPLSSEPESGTSNYKDALLVYPTGVSIKKAILSFGVT